MAPVIEEKIEILQEILSEAAANVRQKIDVTVDGTGSQPASDRSSHRKRIDIDKWCGYISPSRHNGQLSRKRQVQFCGQLSVDDGVGRTGIKEKVEWAGSVDRDGDDNLVRHQPELDLERLLAESAAECGDIEGEGDKDEKTPGEME
jgi:hypothetical protein